MVSKMIEILKQEDCFNFLRYEVNILIENPWMRLETMSFASYNLSSAVSRQPQPNFSKKSRIIFSSSPHLELS